MHAKMTRPLVKICGIKNTKLLAEISTLGVNFIGLIFHPASKRNVDIDTAKNISIIAKENGLIPVGVFVDQSAQEMQEICEYVGLTTVQLHGETVQGEHYLLPADFRRIYAQKVGEHGEVLPDTANGLKYCHPKRDYLLFDNIQAGSGIKFDWESFSRKPDTFKWFLAGGLTPENINEATRTLHPDGVDVSGGVEDTAGEKSLELIRRFVGNM